MLNKIIIFLIVFMYNLFIHHLANFMYKNDAYNIKQSKTTTLLIIMGFIGVLLAKYYFDKIEIINKGLTYGGYILLVTSILANWTILTDELKLFLSGGILFFLIWTSYKKYNINNQSNRKKKHRLNHKKENA